MPTTKTTFLNCILHEGLYQNIDKLNKTVENLFIILNGGKKERIVFLSSNTFSIMTALSMGFNTIPIVLFESHSGDDYQLSLVE